MTKLALIIALTACAPTVAVAPAQGSPDDATIRMLLGKLRPSPRQSLAQRLTVLRRLTRQLGRGKNAEGHGDSVLAAVKPDLASGDIELRSAALACASTLPHRHSGSVLRGLLGDKKAPQSLRVLALRLLADGLDAAGRDALREELPRSGAGPLLQAFSFYRSRSSPSGTTRIASPLTLRTTAGKRFRATLRGLGREGLDIQAEGRIGETIEVVEVRPRAGGHENDLQARFAIGTEIAFTRLELTGTKVTLRAFEQVFEFPRAELRAIVRAHLGGRAVHPGTELDLLCASTGKGTCLGSVIEVSGGKLGFVERPYEPREIRLDDLSSVFFGRGEDTRPPRDLGRLLVAELVAGGRVAGFPLAVTADALCLLSPPLGCITLRLDAVHSLRSERRAVPRRGNMLVTDYGNTRVTEYDDEGNVVWKLEDLFDPLDAEFTPHGTVLVTEQGNNRVVEYDRRKRIVWSFVGCSRPLDADRLPNGNTLITDPGNFRVIEVDPLGKTAWVFGRKEARDAVLKPYDADRLPNGNTLITDYLGARILEVNRTGKTVWKHEDVPFCCDADRLPNGNTLITQRRPAQVIEVDEAGKVVWRLTGLQLPWDADRLADGRTVVAENNGVRIYSKDKKRVATLPAEWAAEFNRR